MSGGPRIAECRGGGRRRTAGAGRENARAERERRASDSRAGREGMGGEEEEEEEEEEEFGGQNGGRFGELIAHDKRFLGPRAGRARKRGGLAWAGQAGWLAAGCWLAGWVVFEGGGKSKSQQQKEKKTTRSERKRKSKQATTRRGRTTAAGTTRRSALVGGGGECRRCSGGGDSWGSSDAGERTEDGGRPGCGSWARLRGTCWRDWGIWARRGGGFVARPDSASTAQGAVERSTGGGQWIAAAATGSGAGGRARRAGAGDVERAAPRPSREPPPGDCAVVIGAADICSVSWRCLLRIRLRRLARARCHRPPPQADERDGERRLDRPDAVRRC